MSKKFLKDLEKLAKNPPKISKRQLKNLQKKWDKDSEKYKQMVRYDFESRNTPLD